MKMPDTEDTGLRYIRIANDLRRRINGGVYQDGERLPPQHQLAKSYGVAFNTLRQALDLLERDGYVARKLGSGTYVHLPSKTKNRVLVVDDEEAIRQLFIRSISSNEWEVEAVGRGEEALERLEQHTYDLIFLDLFMPRMNGAETLAAIRMRNFDCPVVIITGYPDSALVAQALATGPVPMLLKPFSQRDLQLAVQSYARPTIRPQRDGRRVV